MKYFRSKILTYSLIAALSLALLAPFAGQAHAFPLKDLIKAEDQARASKVLDTIGSILIGKDKWLVLKDFRNWSSEKYTSDNNDKFDIQIQQSSPTHFPENSKKEFIGFYAEWWGEDTSSFSSLAKHTDIIQTIAPFWATLDANAEIRNRGGNDHASVVKFAKENNVEVLLLINNEKKEGDNPPIQKVLSNPALRTKAINNIEAYLKQYGLHGVNIDFEIIPPGQKDNLTAFMQELYSKLKPQGYVVSIDVFPKQNETIDISIAYDYEKLSKYADKIMIMTYDNHGRWSGAGPVAGIAWVENNLRYALKFIPKEKLYLGIAAYGYDWSYVNGEKKVDFLDYNMVMERVKKYNAAIKWDTPSQSPYFIYVDSNGVKHTVWFENSYSVKFKLDLIKKYDIAGAAMWKLGEEDPEYWNLFKDMFKNKRRLD